MPELVDFNPRLNKYSTEREASFSTQESTAELNKRLHSLRDASIFNTLSHERKEGYTQVTLWGIPFIDNFGLYVYIKSTVSWNKTTDVDTRFNANIYPLRYLEPEFAFIFKEDEVCSR